MGSYTLLDGRLTLCGKYYKSTEDALWLASNISPKQDESILDVGAGNGAIGLSLSTLHKIPVTLIENNTNLIDSLQSAIEANKITNADILKCTWPETQITKLYDYVISNPPFHLIEEGFQSQTKQKEHGIHKDDLALWIEACCKSCTPTGSVSLFLSLRSFNALSEHLKGLGLKEVTDIISNKQEMPRACIVELTPSYTGSPQHYTLNCSNEDIRTEVLRRGGKIKAHRLARS
ncbi:MAG: methyltransferase [Pseudomonadota bacterium]|nr:methyltransferase [Pseudomonadota bacterium]